MSKRERAAEQARLRVEEARRNAETRMAELRGALRLELGLAAPWRRGWWKVLAAAAVGVAVGTGLWRRRPRAVSAEGIRPRQDA